MASASAAQWQKKAFEPVPEDLRKALEQSPESFAWPFFENNDTSQDLRTVVQKVDFEYLYAGALDLAAAAEDFEDFLHSNPPPTSSTIELSTPLGLVLFRGAATNDEYTTASFKPVLLLVDLGGDDFYGPGIQGARMGHPVQLIFDAAGNDQYYGADHNIVEWGGAFCGYSILVDESGDDQYEGIAVTQGAGVLGVGMLIDRGGNDVYSSFAAAQGYGYAGIGILQDDGGKDHYESLTRAQGCGDCLGAGTLLDQTGDDRYTMNDETIAIPAAQTDKHNSSMGQGMGLGYRADLSDGHSIPGGVGILYDQAGDDRYSAGVFAQGCGFLGGTGFLVDDAGSDTLKGVYYVQGASAHRAVGVLIDREGNDVYESIMQCAQGLGHDLGVGWLVDLSGNDRYSVERLGQGAANENGWGFCIDLRGDDSHEVTIPSGGWDSLGAARLTKWGTLREDLPAFGLFLDAGGHDTYRGPAPARDNARWAYPRQYDRLELRSERGAAWDGEFTRVNLRTQPLTPFPKGEFDLYAQQQALRRQYRGKK